MRWTPGGESQDIEDRRDDSGGGGGGGFNFGGIHIGIGGFILLLVLSLVFKRNFLSLAGIGGSFSPATQTSQPYSAANQAGNQARNAQEKPLVEFVSFVLDDTQQTWTRILSAQGIPYRHAKLVLFRDSIDSACGMAQSATGPFYCPGDEKVYIDLGFYDELAHRFGAPGQFAQAYVLAHEIGHHIQKLTGIEEKVHAAQEQNPGAANRLSVGLELQADCFAGVWGYTTAQRNILEPGEVKGGLDAAAAVGDDRLQRMATGHVNPETFTHGSSQQRMDWFQKGFTTGDMKACNTFAE
ncbi:MAG: neutral zinc metallopeptidase [Terriglobales bacterium]